MLLSNLFGTVGGSTFEPAGNSLRVCLVTLSFEVTHTGGRKTICQNFIGFCAKELELASAAAAFWFWLALFFLLYVMRSLYNF